MRERSWMKNGPCSNCKEFNNCKGNGFHLRDGETKVICVLFRATLILILIQKQKPSPLLLYLQNPVARLLLL